jgi:hypothetical protein
MAINFLVNLDTLKNRSFIDENVEASILKVVLKRVQDLHIEPLLGTPLFKAILLKIENNTMATPYTTLMDDYILPCLYAYCEYVGVSHINNEIRNKAVGKSSDTSIRASSEAELNYIKKEFMNYAEKYEARLIGHLCDDNGVNYPEYIESITDSEEVYPKKSKYLNNVSFLAGVKTYEPPSIRNCYED